jgi:hypothetical protein
MKSKEKSAPAFWDGFQPGVAILAEWCYCLIQLKYGDSAFMAEPSPVKHGQTTPVLRNVSKG